jgi:hypothetical protein
LRLFEDVFREVEAFNYYKCEAFIKMTRIFEDILREMEALIRHLRLFQRLQGFSKITRLFENIFDRIETFSNCFQKNCGLFHFEKH